MEMQYKRAVVHVVRGAVDRIDDPCRRCVRFRADLSCGQVFLAEKMVIGETP